MDNSDLKVKQQIVEKIKSSSSILVTVSKNPTVDELSAAIGLATLLNKMDKHTTAIFSGAVPPAITFLNPDKVFENTADSLRDFIIALDKEKADHLRYKVEGDVVKIFITPYRTVITSDDLAFSQGDFNVELVLALGVLDQDHLDLALAAHGRILHDVTVATFSTGDQTSQLGSIDWHDKNAGSLSEMVVSLGELLKTDKPILDKQIATALLTGIVAATDRFSNVNTTSRAMTMAASLMAAGADQQLIAAKLQESHTIDSVPETTVINTETEVPVMETQLPPVEPIVEQSTLPPDNLTISHDTDVAPEDASVSTLPDIAAVPTSLTSEQINDASYSSSTLAPAYSAEQQIKPDVSVPADPTSEPSLGGVLNATADQAAEDARRELEEQQNKTILTHAYLGSDSSSNQGEPANPFNGLGQTEETGNVDIFADSPMQQPQPAAPVSPVAPVAPPDMVLPPPPVMPDFSKLPPPPLPDFNEPPVLSMGSDSITTIQPLSDDLSQFKIPGQ